MVLFLEGVIGQKTEVLLEMLVFHVNKVSTQFT
jgi:hypothetical protein